MVIGIFGILFIIAGAFLLYRYHINWQRVRGMSDEEYDDSHFDIVLAQEMFMIGGIVLIAIGMMLIIYSIWA